MGQDVRAYYEATCTYLSDIHTNSSYTSCNYNHYSDKEHYKKAMSEHYEQITAALGSASS